MNCDGIDINQRYIKETERNEIKCLQNAEKRKAAKRPKFDADLHDDEICEDSNVFAHIPERFDSTGSEGKGEKRKTQNTNSKTNHLVEGNTERRNIL